MRDFQMQMALFFSLLWCAPLRLRRLLGTPRQINEGPVGFRQHCHAPLRPRWEWVPGFCPRYPRADEGRHATNDGAVSHVLSPAATAFFPPLLTLLTRLLSILYTILLLFLVAVMSIFFFGLSVMGVAIRSFLDAHLCIS
jgi:hypothetical protein